MKNNFNFFALLLIAVLSVQTLQSQSISGKVLYQGDTSRPLNNVTVVLNNIDNNTTETYLTSGDGAYQFDNVADGNYTLTGATTLISGGVTYYDPTLIFLYLNGFYQLTPIQILASDVDGSSTVTWTDYNLIIEYILNGTPFPDGPWKFESTTFTVSKLKDGVPNGLGGTCSGDIGGTFVPTSNNTPALPLAQEGSLNVTGGEPFTTQIFTHADLSITGAGLIINYPSDLLQIESVEFKGTDYRYTIGNGQIRLVWGNPNSTPIIFNDGEPFITIHGTSTAAFKQGMTAVMNLDANTSLMSTSNQDVTNLKFASPVLKYGNPELKLSNFPNPFATSTRLSLYTPEKGNVTIEVSNSCGNAVKNIQVGFVAAGYYQVELDASQMAAGYYICKMHIETSNGEFSKTIRLLKID